MKHLSHSEFVDLIESSPDLAPDRGCHVEACKSCRAEADTLRAAIALAQSDGGAEPSPLFWGHFAARVAEAVHSEVPRGSGGAEMAWRRRPLATWAAVSTAAVLVSMTILWRTTLHAPAPAGASIASTPSSSTSSTAVAVGGDVGDDVDADEAWAVVRAAAVDLQWEDAHAAGLSAHPGAVEDIALELTAEERAELARLLDEAVKHNGA